MYDRVEVYIDESGDLGLSPRSTRYVVVAALATADDRSVERAVKAARKLLRSEGGSTVEMKFRNSSGRVRMRLLEELSRWDPQISWCGLDKRSVPSLLKENREQLIDIMSADVVSHISGARPSKSIAIVLDRRWTKEKRREEFDARIRGSLSIHHAGHFVPALRISHFDSAGCAGLQAADFVAGAIFRSLERGDESYLRVIESNIVHGRLM